MKTKQFTGRTIDEVLAQVREEFGDAAVILETRNVVQGGIAGFFGKAAIEVTAADRMPDESVPGSRVNLLDTGEGSSAHPPVDGKNSDEFLRLLGEHLGTASPRSGSTPAADAPPQPTPGGQLNEQDRARAIIEAARAAVGEAAQVEGPLRAHPSAQVGSAPAPPLAAASAVGEDVASGTELDEPEVAIDDPDDEPVDETRVEGDADGESGVPARPLAPRAEVRALRGELVAGGIDVHRVDGLLDGFSRSVLPFLGADADVRSAARDYLAARAPVVRDWRPWRTGHTIVFVGQSGVGKSASAMKVAGRYRQAGLDVALIAAGAGPHGALLDVARRLDIPVVEASDAAALAAARAQLSRRDLVVVDTPGTSHTAGEALAALARLVGAADADEVHLVLPAATPPGDLGDLHAAFKDTGVTRVTITKLDETRFCGGLLNAPMRIGRPLAYIGDGPGIPSAIAPADPNLVARMVLP